MKLIVIRSPKMYKDVKINPNINNFFVDFILDDDGKKIITLVIMGYPNKMFVLPYPEIKTAEFEPILKILQDEKMFVVND